jgi:predicted ABC-type ATPase
LTAEKWITGWNPSTPWWSPLESHLAKYGCALQVNEFVNADTIAAGLSAFSPEAVAITAGRVMLERVRGLAREGRDFAFETTLASRTFAPWLRKLQSEGYTFHLVYLWLPTVELAVARVAERVRRGGHAVAEDIVRRRYDRSLLWYLQSICRLLVDGQ